MELNWEAIGAVGEILGAFAVFLTLIYVANQIRQANQVAKFNASKEIMNQYNEINKLLTMDMTLRQALMKETSLSPDEAEQIYNFATMFCNIWQSVQAAYDNGQSDDVSYGSGVTDARVEIDRWPNFRPAVERWMATYPEARSAKIFRALEVDGRAE
jgi:hypothetical protein